MAKRILFVLASTFAMVLVASVAFAADPAAASEGGGSSATALALASGFGIAIAAFGGALAQGRAEILKTLERKQIRSERDDHVLRSDQGSPVDSAKIGAKID